jgi:HemY protein
VLVSGGNMANLVCLLAARAAQHLREVGKAQYWLEQVDRDDRRMTPARLMVEAEIHLESRCFTEAAETLQRLQEISGRHIAALRLELRAHEACGNWPEVLRLTRLLDGPTIWIKRDELMSNGAGIRGRTKEDWFE